MIRYKKYQVTGEDSPLKGLWYARPVIEETFDIEKLAKHMSNHNTPYSSGVIKGVLADMVSCTKELILDGKNVKLDDLAIFSVGIVSKKGAQSAADFSLANNVKGLKLRARATGELSNAQINLDGHRVGVDGLTLEHAGLGDGGAVEAPQLREVGDGLAEQARPVLHDLTLIEHGIGEAAADLVHVDDKGPGLVGHAVYRHVLGELLHLHAVADEILLHEIGVGDVPLGGGIGGNHVILGIELAVFVLFPEVLLHLVVLGDEPLLRLRGLLVVQGPAEELQLVQIQVVLVLGHIGGVADETVFAHGDGGLVVFAALHRVADGAVEQGIGGRVVGGHVVGGVLIPAGGGVVACLHGDVVPGLVVLGGAVLLGVFAGGVIDGVHGGHVAEGPGALQGVIHEQVILQIGLVGRGAGLDLQLGPGIVDEAVQLHQGDGLPLDQVGGGHLGLDLGLIGAVTVQVKALHVAPLIVL